MSFRELFLERLARRQEKLASAVFKPIVESHLAAFTRKELETSVQLYRHLKSLGYTVEDLINYMRERRTVETRVSLNEASRVTVGNTREERKRLKAGGSFKGRQRRGEV